MNLQDLIDSLSSQAKSLEDPQNTALVLSEQHGSGSEVLLGIVSDALVHAATIIKEACEHLKNVDLPEPELTSEHLDQVAVLASELDNSEDPEMRKKASVLDQLLLTISAPKGALTAFKLAEEKEIENLRQKYRDQATEEAFTKCKKEHDKDIKVADAVKAIAAGVKEYRPLEAPLSTRTCPDHPGAQMGRIADNIYQCSLDKQIYNWQGGFTTMRGNRVPGGDVSLQTQSLNDRPMEHMSFSTRESKLNG